MAKILQVAITNYLTHMQDREYPACFTEKEYIAWRGPPDEVAQTLPFPGFACRDCSTVYQKKMTLEGRCVNSRIPLDKVAD